MQGLCAIFLKHFEYIVSHCAPDLHDLVSEMFFGTGEQKHYTIYMVSCFSSKKLLWNK